METSLWLPILKSNYGSAWPQCMADVSHHPHGNTLPNGYFALISLSNQLMKPTRKLYHYSERYRIMISHNYDAISSHTEVINLRF